MQQASPILNRSCRWANKPLNIALPKQEFGSLPKIGRLVAHWCNRPSLHELIKCLATNFQYLQGFSGIQQRFIVHGLSPYTKYTMLTIDTANTILHIGDNVHNITQGYIVSHAILFDNRSKEVQS
jgi:hypothetical protein